jgi:hypothetical protein
LSERPPIMGPRMSFAMLLTNNILRRRWKEHFSFYLEK